MTTIIDDSNIHTLVETYIYDKSKLPDDLHDIPIGDWDVSRVTNMSELFVASPFNEPINNWNVSNVTNMIDMFNDCHQFNQPLNSWNVSNVTDMGGMFISCNKFNQPLNNWNVSNVTNMWGIFSGCDDFNQPLYSWNVSNVTDMGHMFSSCYVFNHSLNSWNVSNVTNMEYMFNNCYAFNHSLNRWNVSNVTNMDYMFSGCYTFNHSLNSWNVSNVNSMEGMFTECYAFNQPLNHWNVSNVTNMEYMFYKSYAFNQRLNTWNVNNVANMENMFTDCPISNANKPNRLRLDDVDDVDPNQIHKESAKIDYEKLITILKSKTGNNEVPNDLNYPTFINDILTHLINESDETTEVKTKQKEDLEQIMIQRLNRLDYSYNPPVLNKLIYYTLEYVKLQPLEFKNAYVNALINDCVGAYEGINGMTCSAGAFERIITSLQVGIVSSVIKKSEYEIIIDIISSSIGVFLIVFKFRL